MEFQECRQLLSGLLTLVLAGCTEQTSESMPAPTPPANVAVNPWDTVIEAPVAGDPERAMPLLQRALQAVQALRDEEAQTHFEAALAADPAHLPTMVEYGYFLLDSFQLQSHHRALLMFRTAALAESGVHSEVERDQLRQQARWGEGITLRAIGHHAGAQPLLEEALTEPALQQFPARAAAVHHALAAILFAKGDAEGADHHYREAIARATKPTVLGAYHSDLAALAIDAMNWPLAEEQIKQSLAHDPQNVRAHYQLLRVYERSGAEAEASRQRRIHEVLRELQSLQSKSSASTFRRRIELRKEFISLFPYPRATRILIREMLTAGFYADAVREVSIERQRQGAFDAELFYLLARAKAGQGDLAAAKQAAMSMRKLNPRAPVEVIRDILDEWRNANPNVDAGTYERLLQEWMQGP